MSEQKQSYMQQLDAWTFQSVIEPLLIAAESGGAAEWNKARDGVYAAIRQKVLESYRNGQDSAGGERQPSSFRPRQQQSK